VSSIGIYQYINNTFKVEDMFTCLAIFTSIQNPMRSLPTTFDIIMETITSMKRIEYFLKLPEIQNDKIIRDDYETKNEGIAIRIVNGRFKWGKIQTYVKVQNSDMAKMVKLADQLLTLLDKQAKVAGILKDDGTLCDAATSTKKLVDKSEAEASGSTIAPKNPLKQFGSLFKKKTEQQQVEVFVWTNDYRAEYLLIKAALLKTKNGLDDEEAIGLLEQIPKMEKVLIDKWYLPYAWFELCESYFNRKKYHEAAQALKKCMSYDDYAWEDPLRVRARVTADHLKKALEQAHVTEDIATDDAEDVKESASASATTTTTASEDLAEEKKEEKAEEKKEEKAEEKKEEKAEEKKEEKTEEKKEEKVEEKKEEKAEEKKEEKAEEKKEEKKEEK